MRTIQHRAATAKQRAILRQKRKPRHLIRDIKRAPWPTMHGHGLVMICPIREPFTITGENLHAIILPIRDCHAPIRQHPNGMRRGEFTGPRPWPPPMAHRRAIRAEAMHHRCAIAIRDIDRTIRLEGDIARRVKGLTRAMPLAKPAKPFAVTIENDDFLRVAIHDENAPIGMNGQHMPIRHVIPTPGSDALAIRRQHHHRRTCSAAYGSCRNWQ